MCKLSEQKEKRGMLVLTLSLILGLLAGINNPCFGEGVGIWDNDTSNWITTFAGGDPIDAATGSPAYLPQMAVDPSGRVYVTYYQSDGVVAYRIYLSRYNGTDVRIWDNDTPSWITNFAGGDPIDAATGSSASNPQIAVDSNGKVYVVYEQSNGAANDIYLSRYDGNMRIWDTDGWVAVDTPGNGDPIDVTGNSAFLPQIAVDLRNGKEYVTYYQSYQSDGQFNHIYLNRCDGDDVRIWDNDTSDWITTFALGDPIDTTTSNHAYYPQIAVDSNGVVYVVYVQSLLGVNRIYLSRYDDTNGV